MKLEEILSNLRSIVDRYQIVPLIQTTQLSEILRDLGCNISYLVTLRSEYYSLYQKTIRDSKAQTITAKVKEADREVPELDHIKNILKHYSELEKDLRTQISLYKSEKM